MSERERAVSAVFALMSGGWAFDEGGEWTADEMRQFAEEVVDAVLGADRSATAMLAWVRTQKRVEILAPGWSFTDDDGCAHVVDTWRVYGDDTAGDGATVEDAIADAMTVATVRLPDWMLELAE